MVLSEKNLQTLIDMGFEVTYKADDFMKLYHEEYDLGIELYHSDPRDDYQGVLMDITRDKVSLKECKGRNVISNIKRWIEKYCIG